MEAPITHKAARQGAPCWGIWRDTSGQLPRSIRPARPRSRTIRGHWIAEQPSPGTALDGSIVLRSVGHQRRPALGFLAEVQFVDDRTQLKVV